MSTPLICSCWIEINFLLYFSQGYFFYWWMSQVFFYYFFLGSFFMGLYSMGVVFTFFRFNSFYFISLYFYRIFSPLKLISMIFSDIFLTSPSKVAISNGYFNNFFICYSYIGIEPALIFFYIQRVTYGILKNSILPLYILTIRSRQKSWI